MTSLRSRTRVCRHTVVCGRLTGGMGPGASLGASPFLPPLLSWVGWGFVAERRPARLRFAFSPCGARVSWVARLVGWLAFRAVAPHFFSRGALSGIAAPRGCLRSRFSARGFEGLLVLGSRVGPFAA